MEIYINGIGIISRCAYSKEELTEAAQGMVPETRTLPLDFPSMVPSSKLRRNSRYNKMACAAADQALKDACIPGQLESGLLDSHLVGTILSTGYGAAEYNCLFAESVVKGDPNVCSPAVFSGSVPNACVGQICIVNGLKGFSTILAGGDPLEYSALLLKTGRAKYILTGSVEEYYPALYEAFDTFEAARGCDLSECAAMAVLSGERTENSYCRIGRFAGVNLGKNPCLHCLADAAGTRKRIADVFRPFSKPDIVFTAANGTWFDREEAQAVEEVFPSVPIYRPKELFGETLGCGYMMNVLLGACAIRNGKYDHVLVSGMDMIGNYCCVMLER